MLIKILVLITILLTIFKPSISLLTTNPTWIASSYFRAGNYQLVSVHLAPSDPPAQHTFIFNPAFNTTPNLGYGIKQYRGNDTFYQQELQCTRNGSVTTTQFTVQFIILGFTQLYRLSVAYIAIDGSFPHHVRSFENIPINYNVTLTGINSASPSTRSFTNTINYPALLVDKGYSSETFPLPLTGVKLLLFMTSAFYYHHPKNKAVDYSISYTIISATLFSLTCIINNDVQLNKLHFSMLFFNTDEIAATNKYQVKYGSLTSALSSQSFQFSDAVDQSFVMGIYSLKSSSTNCSIQYVWTKTSSSPFTIQISIPAPLGGSYANCGLTQSTSIYFYFRQWSCIAPYFYFNKTINMCQDLCDTGYYENTTDYQCYNCSNHLPNCQDCSSYNTCTQCSTGYLVNANNQCAVDCSTLSNCLSCTNITQCVDCQVGWALDSNNLCTLNCTTSLSNCLDCNIITECILCSIGFYLDNNNLCIQDCTGNIPNCKTCSIPTICDECFSGFVIDMANQCSVDCSGLTNCVTCTSSTICSQCDNGYILDINSLCIINCIPYSNCLACTPTQCTQCNLGYNLDGNNICIVDCSGLSNCLSCIIPTECYQCGSGYILNANNICQVDCSGLSNCLTCTIPTQCDQCYPQYVLDANYLCIADCSGLSNCVTCVISTQCSQCDPGYILDSNNLCILDCSPYPNCLICTLTQCTQCNLGYTLDANDYCIVDCSGLSNCLSCIIPTQCSLCDNGYILDSNNLCIIDCSPYPYCLSCILSQCTQCISGYLLNANDQCYADCSGLLNCLSCFIPTECSQCNIGYMLNSNNLCIINCTFYFSNCQICTNITQCALCQNGYIIDSNGLCISNCSAFLSDCLACSNPNQCLQCQSGKILNSNNQCINPTPQNPQQQCYSDPSFLFQLSSIVKNRSQNSIKITFKFDQQSFFILEKINLQSYLYTNMSFILQLVQIQKDNVMKTISYSFNYTESIQNQFVQFEIPYNHSRFNDCPLTKVFQLIASNNLPIIKFSEQTYKTKQVTQEILKGIEYLSFGVLIASMIPAKIVGIQLFGVLQLAFFSLAEQNSVNLMLSSIMEMKQLNGYNIFINQNQVKQLPNRVSSLQYKEDFVNNCNIMLFILVSQIVLALILYAISLVFKAFCPKITKYAQFFLKQICLTLILFNCFNITFSATLQLKYGNQEHDLYHLSLILALFSLFLLLAMIGMLAFSSSKGFGQYKDKFKNDWPSRSYFVLTIIYRSSLGVYIALMNQYQLSTLVIMSFSLFFFIYHLVNLPFQNVYHNYRSTLCHLTFIVILFVSLYYRSMKSSDSIEQVALINIPAYLQIFMIVFCLVVSIAMLVYQFYHFIKRICFEKKQIKQPSRKSSNESLAKINDNSIHYSVENLYFDKMTAPQQLKEAKQIEFYFMQGE